MWAEKPAAFLIIHGIGEQNPYETLDSFVRPFWSLLEKENMPRKVTCLHKCEKRKGWIENYVSLKLDQSGTPIDFFEHYWANIPQRRVNLQEIFDWLITTSDGAGKFYEENNKLAAKYEELGVKAFKNGKFEKYWYLRHMGVFLRLLSFIKITRISYLDPVINLFLNEAKQVLISYLGDVVAYTSTDIKSKTFEIRKQILDGAVEHLKLLLKDERYGQIIVAGHSLGSVIGYDCLNRINLQMNVDPGMKANAGKIKGFVTFGSPLDKIAFFFREHTKPEEFIRRQILSHFHSFKSLNLNLKKDETEIENPYQSILDKKVYWMNFWNPKDPISGHLDFYDVDENIKLDLRSAFGLAHTKYWGFSEMYKNISKRYLI
ncbi:MAG: hypothetical protein AB1498_07425 [bacterium]